MQRIQNCELFKVMYCTVHLWPKTHADNDRDGQTGGERGGERDGGRETGGEKRAE